MTYKLATLEELKRNLRYDGTAHDDRLTDILEDASAAVVNYIADTNAAALEGWTDSGGAPLTDSNGDPELDSNGESLVPRAIRRATLLACGVLDANPEGQGDPITPAVKSVLARYRTPVAV